jgi:hypothetical protein
LDVSGDHNPDASFVWKQPGFLIKKRKILPTSYNYYCDMKFLQEKSGSAHEIGARNPRAKSFTRSGGGESGLVIVTGRITSAINKRGGGEEGRREAGGKGAVWWQRKGSNGEGEPEKYREKRREKRWRLVNQ